ncbi:MAG: 2-hydroxyacid dehydrogenase [Thermoplasmatota archaeon]
MPRSLQEAAVVEGPINSDIVARYARARVLSVSYADRPTPDLLAGLPALRAIVTRSDGFDHLPDDWMRAHNVAGYNLGDYAVQSVAEVTLAHLTYLLRRYPEAITATRSATWSRAGLEGRGLAGSTVVVLGVGKIGSRVARLLSGAGSKVVGVDIVRNEGVDAIPNFAWATSLEEALAVADALTIHVPLTRLTRAMIGARQLALMRKGAVLVNTARGEVVDDGAVAKALEEGRLGGFAADVLAGEPSPPGLARLAKIRRAIVTPHIASFDVATIAQRYERAGLVADAILMGHPERVEHLRVI